ncbi:hypothetical protein [Nonlabens sp. Asnod3-A02]|uniref:hypothetical protein n=1 Tax=Nonlabens sp. Asnod3-A02 TaxID=3160579 RepID=UPI00386EA5E7
MKYRKYFIISFVVFLLISCSSKKEYSFKTVDYRNVYQYLDNYLIFDGSNKKDLVVTTNNGTIKQNENGRYILNFEEKKRTSLFITYKNQVDTIVVNAKKFPNPKFQLHPKNPINNKLKLKDFKKTRSFSSFLPNFNLNVTWNIEDLKITKVRDGKVSIINGSSTTIKIRRMVDSGQAGDQYFITDIRCRLNIHDHIIYAKSINFEVVKD